MSQQTKSNTKMSFKHIWYRTMTNLLYPAVLGTLIVKSIDFVLSYQSYITPQFTIIKVAFTLALLYYFILDYWVTLIEFDDKQSSYGSKLFAIDLVIILFLYVSFYFLWGNPADPSSSDFHLGSSNANCFYITILIVVGLLICWNVDASKIFNQNEPYTTYNYYLSGFFFVTLIQIQTPFFDCPPIYFLLNLLWFFFMIFLLFGYTKKLSF